MYDHLANCPIAIMFIQRFLTPHILLFVCMYIVLCRGWWATCWGVTPRSSLARGLGLYFYVVVFRCISGFGYQLWYVTSVFGVMLWYVMFLFTQKLCFCSYGTRCLGLRLLMVCTFYLIFNIFICGVEGVTTLSLG